MGGNVLGLILAALVVRNAQCQSPPVMKDSFIAWGEIVQPAPDTEGLIVLQMAFEESYDATNQNAALFLFMSGKNLTFVKNYKANQTFLYIETEKNKMQCTETSEKEWMVTDFAPSLLSFEDDDGTVKFSLTQLLNIPDKYLMDKLRGIATTHRGIPAKSWTYEIKSKKKDDAEYDTTLSITSYWSDDKWNMSAGQRVTPLGFNVSKLIWSDPVVVEDYFVNVFGFVPYAYDHKYFEPYQGIVCSTRKNTLKFPNVKNIRAISLHSEMALPDYQEVRYIDMWFDPLNQLVRLDVERLKYEDPMERKQKHYQSEVAIGKMGVVYRFSYYKGESECEIIPFDKYENDLQNFFNIKQDLKRWQMGKIFGLNDTSYVYIGKTTKNDVPCHIFQGIRTDWPDKNSNITSLWEWCFNVNMSNVNDIVMFQDDEFGLINANVIILSAPNKLYNNYRMNHHFYEVKAQDPKILDAISFDIGKCYKDTQKRVLQFYLTVDITKDNRHLAENATSDVSFLQKWKAAIYRHTSLPEYSLRVSAVRATIDDSKLFIKFSLLGVHDDLPSGIKDNLTAFEAERKLRNNINSGKVSIIYKWSNGKATGLQAAKHSVSFQIDPKFQPQTVPPLPSTTPGEETPFPFTLRTEPHDGKSDSTTGISGKSDITSIVSGISDITDPSTGKDSTSTDDISTMPPNREKKHIVRMHGHGPGAVAGICIAMLLVGISVGSAGTFYKFNGLPACVKS